MRQVLREVKLQVESAFARFDTALRGLSGRVAALEQKPLPSPAVVERVVETRTVVEPTAPAPEVVQAFVDAWLTQNPLEIDEADLEPLVASAVAAWQRDNPTPSLDLTALAARVAQILDELDDSDDSDNSEDDSDNSDDGSPDDSEGESERAELDIEQLVAAVLSRLTLPAAPEVDYERVAREAAQLVQVPEPQPGRDGRSLARMEIVGNDLFAVYSDGVNERVGTVVGRDGEPGESVLRVETVTLPPPDVVSIEDITLEGEVLTVTLTNGDKKPFKLPKVKGPAQYISGSTISEARVLELIAQNSGGGGGDVSSLELFSPAPLLAYKVLTTNALGQAIYADAGTLAHADQVVGVGLNAGTTIRVAEFGEVVNNGWNWTAGQALFLGLNGDIVTTPRLGVFNIQIGYAKTATSIIVKLGRSIILG